MTTIPTDVFDKTGKGRDEITTRQCQLPARLRTLLLLVDGKRDTVELMAKVAGLGLDERSLQELLDEKFIERIDANGTTAGSTLTEATPRTAPTSTDTNDTQPGSNILRNGETQFQALTNFFNETIRNVIGLRGFTLQLKVERATTLDDFRALRQPYLEAVLKAKGAELEHSLRNRLDQLLNIEG